MSINSRRESCSGTISRLGQCGFDEAINSASVRGELVLPTSTRAQKILHCIAAHWLLSLVMLGASLRTIGQVFVEEAQRLDRKQGGGVRSAS